MKFESIVRSDLDHIKHLQPKGWNDITKDIQFYINNDYCYPYKVVKESQIIGIGASIIFGDTAWLAHIIVDEKFRNQGIGHKITQYLLDDMKKRSIETILLIATTMGEPVYKKVGFKVISTYVELIRNEPLKETETSKNIIPYQKEYYSKILELDKEISGENRERHLKEHIEKSKLFIENKEIKGFYIPGLGEGLIFAKDSISGIELLKLKHKSIDKAVLPEENTTGIEFLRKNGFSEPKLKGIKMVWGRHIEWKPKDYYSRIGGNVG